MVIRDHLEYGIPKDQLKAKYGIKGKSAILNWMRKFAATNEEPMSKKQEQQPTTPPSAEFQEVARLKAENERLEKALAHEKLHVKVLNTMIDIAERELKILVRKKTGAKQ
jgi:transposase